MSNNTILKTEIGQRVQAFAQGPLRQSALALLLSLGYQSDRTVQTPTLHDFRQQFDPQDKLSHPNALLGQWEKAELLFQLTDEELSRSVALFKDDAVRTSLLQSYVFVAVELQAGDYARGKLAGIARQINRLFPMPVMVLFKVAGQLSIAVINRRVNKRDEQKDVLGKVTLIQNIQIAKPHPGHLDILTSFSLAELSANKRSIQNFDQLHAAWEEVFNVELLNKRFYEELSNWYFWARQQVSFPADLEPEEATRNATSVIRLLTRLIFCWFLKEKGLIPERLFDADELPQLLTSLDDQSSSYYHAILQNLFFATLNQPMNAGDAAPRKFAANGSFHENRTEHGVKNLYRYDDHFRQPDQALGLFADIPFLNGGLFACLDIEDDSGKVQYADGFSRNTKQQARVPNHLFFAEPHTVDLSGKNHFGDTKKKKAKVRGLLHILNGYKFTIAESTPVEQEIALDPELLGNVFENLLASYNPETGESARRQTGSFYTPRPIVDHMVDEALKAYLADALCQRLPATSMADAQAGLDILFAYTEKTHAFTDAECSALIAAIDACNILDPACGSGAYPMGILHKLVFVLGKLDPHNEKWRQRQINKAEEIEDAQARESAIAAINQDFAQNALDYGRKLYLIENCIYGLDIQPIAIQIAKLRFFISLICDQKTSNDRSRNLGIRPLPNLETKFVAANSLLGLSLPSERSLFVNPEIEALEKALERVRHRYFSAQTRQAKRDLQKRDRELVQKIIKLLKADDFGSEDVYRRIAWNPYDPHSVADFFDSATMFGPDLEFGFDVVIGNPPYVQVKKGVFSVAQFPWSEGKDVGKQNLYKVFVEAAYNFLKPKGIASLIVQSSLMADLSSARTREMLLTQTKIKYVLEFPKIAPTKAGQVFASVLQGTCICQFQKMTSPDNKFSISCNNDITTISSLNSEIVRQSDLVRFRPVSFELPLFKSGEFSIYRQIFKESIPLKSIVVSIEKGDLNLGTNADSFSNIFSSVKLYRGRNIQRFSLDPNVSDWVKPGNFLEKAKRNRENKILVCQEITGTVDPRRLIFTLIEKLEADFLFGDTVQKIILRNQSLSQMTLAILNSRLMDWCFRKTSTNNHVGGYELGALPFPALISNKSEEVLTLMVDYMLALIQLSRKIESNFIDAVIDACVMELYFAEHMAERDLAITAQVRAALPATTPSTPEALAQAALDFYQNANDAQHPIRNMLLRIPLDSPELLGVIQKEGAV
jgi:adenine-specific DNA-methyltransferase